MRKIIFLIISGYAGMVRGQSELNIQLPVSISTSSVQSSLDPEDYLWAEVSDLLQGVNIYLPPATSPYRPDVYMQQGKGRLAFSVENTGSFLDKIEVNYDNSGWITAYEGISRENWGWLEPPGFFRTLGHHSLKVRYRVIPSSAVHTREYDVYMVPDAVKLFRDDVSTSSFYRNKLTLWQNENAPGTQVPILLVEGFDAYNLKNAEYYRYVAKDLINKLLENNYKVYVLDFAFNAQEMERNAAVVRSAISLLSDLNNNEEIIVAGASMGGIIARYALAEDETEKRNGQRTDFLPVSHYISFDSPHLGAVISRELMAFVHENDAGNYTFGTPAFQQLVRNQSGPRSPSWRSPQELFYSKLNALYNNGYPSHCVNIGVSFSRPGLSNPDKEGTWLEIEGKFGGLTLVKHEDWVDGEEELPGSLLPLTTGVMNDTRAAWNLVNTSTAKTDKNPTFIPYFSAQDRTDVLGARGGHPSRHCISIETINNDELKFHDVFPPELIDRIIGALKSTDLAHIPVNQHYNFTSATPGILANDLEVDGNFYLNRNLGSGSSLQPGSLPSPGSEYGVASYGCNNITITLNNGAGMRLGDHAYGNRGILTISKNGSLVLKTGSFLQVEQGSRLVIDASAKLIVEPGATILLEDTGSVLEIRGILEIASGAVFQTSGTGYVLFNSVATDPQVPYNILCGENAGASFTGTNREKKLEVASGTSVWPDDRLSLFQISGAGVELGTDAYLNLGCNVVLESSSFRKIPGIKGVHVHGGIRLYGQKNHQDPSLGVSIKNCRFSDAKYGISSFQTIGGKSVRLTGNSFEHCETAVFSHGHGIYLAGNNFRYCVSPFKGVEMSGNGLFEKNNVGLSQGGFYFQGTSTGNIIGGGNKFYKTGGIWAGGSEITLMCNVFKENFNICISGNSHLNLNSQESPKLMPGTLVKGGYNWFDDNMEAVSLAGSASYDFNQGYNFFRNTSWGINNGTSINILIAGRTALDTDNSFYTNAWSPAHYIPWQPSVPVTDLLAFKGYEHFNANTTEPYMIGTEISYSEIPECPVIQWRPAPAYAPYNPDDPVSQALMTNVPAYLLGDLRLENPQVLVRGGVFNGVILEEAARDAINSAYAGAVKGTVLVNPQGLGKLKDLITYTGTDISWQDTRKIYRYYMVYLANAVYSGVYETGTSPYEDVLSQTIDLIDGLLICNDLLNMDVELNRINRLQLDMDKAETYKLFGKYQQSITVLNTIFTYALNEEVQLTEMSLCYAQAMENLRQGLITGTPEFADSVLSCQQYFESYRGHFIAEYPVLYVPEDSLSFSLEEEFQYDPGLPAPEPVEFLLAPNPCHESLSVMITLYQEFYTEVKIYNKFGILLHNEPMGSTPPGTHTLSLDTRNYPDDVYYLHIVTNGFPRATPFVVNHTYVGN
jgi:hypothetical protein